MTISIDGKLVHRAELWAAYRDRWTLEIAYPDTVVPSGRVSVQWGAATFVGTVDPTHTDVFNSEVVAKIVGGWGWSVELPADWYQSDNPGVSGRLVAQTAAQAVGETLYGPTGTTAPPANSFRPLRVSYSRSKQTAGSVLNDVLAPGVAWWTEFDGATRVGVRVAPSPAARVALLEYFPGNGWADIEADDPAGLLGATIPADDVRGTPALVINELFAWAGEEGFRYRAAVAPMARAESTRMAEALRALVRSFVPEVPALAIRRARVTSQANDGRVSVQQVDRAGVVDDFGRNEGAVRLYAGLPGASADLDTSSTPETILAFARADWSDAIAFLAPPVGMPGHVPLVARLEASNELRFVGASAGVVRVGAAPTEPVAIAPEVSAAFDLVIAAFTAVVAYATAAGVAVPALATAAATLSAALTTPITGLLPLLDVKDATYPLGYTATKLEAK